jgi:hypothetical protein
MIVTEQRDCGPLDGLKLLCTKIGYATPYTVVLLMGHIHKEHPHGLIIASFDDCVFYVKGYFSVATQILRNFFQCTLIDDKYHPIRIKFAG